MKNLENFNVQELNNKEIKNINGGIIKYFVKALKAVGDLFEGHYDHVQAAMDRARNAHQ